MAPDNPLPSFPPCPTSCSHSRSSACLGPSVTVRHLIFMYLSLSWILIGPRCYQTRQMASYQLSAEGPADQDGGREGGRGERQRDGGYEKWGGRKEEKATKNEWKTISSTDSQVNGWLNTRLCCILIYIHRACFQTLVPWFPDSDLDGRTQCTKMTQEKACKVCWGHQYGQTDTRARRLKYRTPSLTLHTDLSPLTTTTTTSSIPGQLCSLPDLSWPDLVLITMTTFRLRMSISTHHLFIHSSIWYWNG